MTNRYEQTINPYGVLLYDEDGVPFIHILAKPDQKTIDTWLAFWPDRADLITEAIHDTFGG